MFLHHIKFTSGKSSLPDIFELAGELIDLWVGNEQIFDDYKTLIQEEHVNARSPFKKLKH